MISLPHWALSALIVFALVISQAQAQTETMPAPAALSLTQALEKAQAQSPVLGAFTARAGAATANLTQASALPNPEISIEADNIYGDRNGTEDAEITYGISQLIELPGKRGSRIKAADAQTRKGILAREAARQDLIRDVTIAYAGMVAAQQDVMLLSEEYDLAREIRDSVAAKAEAGKVPPLQKNKAEIALSASALAHERAQRQLYAHKQVLFALIGGSTGDFSVVPESLPALAAPNTLAQYRARLKETPDALSLDTDIHQAQALLALERAQSLPDPTFNIGIKDMREDNSQTFVAGMSLPLPVFNLNRAGIERARHELNAVKLDQHSALLAQDTALTDAYSTLSNAYNEALTLKESILPGAEKAFDFARTGYDAGKFDYLEVLDAQRTLFDARRQFNTSILDYHRARATLERLTAAPHKE